MFRLWYWTGTDLLCVITSLSVWGKISCNIILKYMLDVWEMFSECHNLGFLQTQIQHPKKKKYINDQKLEIWTRGHVYLCLSASPSFTVVRLSLLENTGSSHYSSGNFLSTEWRVLLKSWLKGELTDIHLEGLGDKHTKVSAQVMESFAWILGSAV